MLHIFRELYQTITQTAEEFLVVVARAEHQTAVTGQFVQRVQHVHLFRHIVHRSGQLVQYGTVQAFIDGIHGDSRR